MRDSASIPTEPKRRGVLHWLRKVAVIVSAFALLFITAGLLYRATEARADAKRFHQEGRSVDIGGYKLNINCTGQGSPTVILESGLEVPAIGWRLVQPDIAKFTRVCSYDRAGYGWSDPGPMPRTSAQIVRELHTLLQNAGEQPPFVLVGHSFGGTNVRVYNALYPSDVVGMVLAEAGHEDLKLPDSIQKLSDADLKRRQRDRELARLRFWLGISRFAARREIDNPASSHGRQESRYFDTQPKFIDATTSEVENLLKDYDELRATGTLGDKPLIVLIAGEGMFGLPLTSKDWVDLRNMWVDFHMRLAHLSSRGKWIMVPHTGHMIPYQRPDAIVSAVREVFAAINLP
jgi:pimeloyl-ACP methyl ester carboxylesterase